MQLNAAHDRTTTVPHAQAHAKEDFVFNSSTFFHSSMEKPLLVARVALPFSPIQKLDDRAMDILGCRSSCNAAMMQCEEPTCKPPSTKTSSSRPPKAIICALVEMLA
eukprot:2136966-Amphidinium_carterae.1